MQDIDALVAELVDMEISRDAEQNRRAIQHALNEKLYTRQEILGRAVEFLLG